MEFILEVLNEIKRVLHSLDVLPQVNTTLILLITVLALRWGLILWIRRWNTPSGDEKRRWIIQVKNISIIILAAGLFGIWASELRSFALSMVAVAAALAIATKEIIQCFMGGFYKASEKPFSLGDRIEINGVRGEVIDHDFLSTKLLEIGPEKDVNLLSGRQTIIPNSWLLSYPVHNQSVQQDYTFQTIRCVLEAGESAKALEELMLGVANEQCRDFLEPARQAMNKIGQREGLDLPRVEPRVSYQYGEAGSLHLSLRFPAPIGQVIKTEQAILRALIFKRAQLALRPV